MRLWLGLFVCLTLSAQFPPVERAIAPGESHEFKVSAKEGDFLYGVADQSRADVGLRLFSPAGQRIAFINRLSANGTEELFWLVTEPGEYTIAVYLAKNEPPGNYRFELEHRTATADDRVAAEAYKLGLVDVPAMGEPKSANDVRAAIVKLDKSLTLWRQASNVRWEAYIANELGARYEALSNMSRALEYWRQSLAAYRKLPDQQYGLSIALNSVGMALSKMSDLPAAESHLREALAIREKLGIKQSLAISYNNLGLFYVHLDRMKTANEHFQKSLALRRESNDRRGEAVTLSNLSMNYFNTGDVRKAIECQALALQIRRDLKDLRGQSSSLNGLAQAYYDIGDLPKAAEFARESGKLADQIGDVNALAASQYLLGSIASRDGNLAEARRHFQSAIEARRRVGNKQGELNTLHALGEAEAGQGDPEKGIAACTESLNIGKAIGNPSAQGLAMFCLGRIALRQKQYEVAARHLTESETILRSVQRTNMLADTVFLQARLADEQGNLEAAIPKAEEALAIADSRRSTLNVADVRASFRGTRAERMTYLIDLLMRSHAVKPEVGYDIRAFEAAEKWRARSLAEELAGGTVVEFTAEQKKKDDEFQARISNLQAKLFRNPVSVAERKELQRQLSLEERDRQILHLAAGGQGTTGYTEVLDLDGVRSKTLSADSALLLYVLGDRASYVWAVTPSEFRSAVLPGRKEIEARAERYRKALSERVTTLTVSSAVGRLDAESKALYDTLIQPVEPALAGVRRLIVSADGLLTYVPFETLGSGKRLLERYAISYAPSGSTLADLRSRGQQRPLASQSLLAFADPAYGRQQPAIAKEYVERGLELVPLPNTRTEVTGIQALFRPGTSKLFLGTSAKEEQFKSEKLDTYRFVHIAAHGYSDEQEPARSGVVLTPGATSGDDGVLQGPEVAKLKLNADMVTLSACQTGLGKLVAAEGVLGISRSFLIAGAQSVTVSLWNVNDVATAELMKQFYRGLTRGLARDEALRQAKLAMLRSGTPAWRHPYYWAPFVLVGDAH